MPARVGWPASAWFEYAFGWREACLIWAGLNLFAALPLNWLIIPPAPPLAAAGPHERAEPEAEPPRGAMPILAFYFCATAFVTGAMAAHLPRLLEGAGASEASAIAAGALRRTGTGRGAPRRIRPLARDPPGVVGPHRGGDAPARRRRARACSARPGSPSSRLLHGAGNGMITIAQGTLPLAIFGAAGYGLRTGILAAPARVTLAAAPFVFGVLLDAIGTFAVLVSAGLSLAAFLSLWLLRPRPAPAVAPAASD